MNVEKLKRLGAVSLLAEISVQAASGQPDVKLSGDLADGENLSASLD
jgi:hypothetical protein